MAQDVAQHRSDNYAEASTRFTSREAFLESAFFAPWTHQLHEAFKRALGEPGRILSIGSGVGEHDVLLHLAGYDVTATDLIPDVGGAVQEWFADLAFRPLDVLDPQAMAAESADCVLASGLDYALDDAQLDVLFANVASLLSASGHEPPRFVFTVRYRNNLLTRVIDDLLLPMEAYVRLWIRGRQTHQVVRRAHGFRRTPLEVIRLASRHGFVHRATDYAGIGLELERSALLRRVPLLRAIDRYLHVACTCVVIVFDLIQAPTAEAG